MKIPPYIILIVLVLTGTSVFAGRVGPPPPRTPGPPGLPIDDNLLIMLIIALVYGVYKIYDLKLNKKTPM
jgi:hypothetical protein